MSLVQKLASKGWVVYSRPESNGGLLSYDVSTELNREKYQGVVTVYEDGYRVKMFIVSEDGSRVLGVRDTFHKTADEAFSFFNAVMGGMFHA